PADGPAINYAAVVSATRPLLPELEHVIVVGEKVPDGCMSFADFEAKATTDFQRPEISPDEPHILAYTSGTTSDPKGVVHSHNSLLAECRQTQACSGGSEDDVFLCPNPIGHIAGIFSALIAPFLYGYRKLVLMDGWDPRW